jgi:hypothetical protein
MGDWHAALFRPRNHSHPSAGEILRGICVITLLTKIW